MKFTIKTSEMKKVLTVFKKLDKSLLNRDRIISFQADENNMLVVSYRTGFEEITWTPLMDAGTQDAGNIFHVAMGDFEKAFSGALLEITGDAFGVLRVNGIPVAGREAPFNVPGFEIIGNALEFDAIHQKYFLHCAAAASTRKAEEKVLGTRPRYSLTYVQWDKTGMVGTNGKVLIHEACGGNSEDPIYIPNNAVVKAMIAANKGCTMEVANMTIPPEEKHFASHVKLMLRGEHFTYWMSWQEFSYPNAQHVMTHERTNAKVIEFRDVTTPLIPGLAFENKGYNDMICITRENDGKVYLSNDLGMTEINAEAEEGFPGCNVRQEILGIALATGIRKFWRTNEGQFWGISGDEGTYVTFMGCIPFVNPQKKPVTKTESEETATA